MTATYQLEATLRSLKLSGMRDTLEARLVQAGARRAAAAVGRVPVASSADIIQSKTAAVRPKDFDALPEEHELAGSAADRAVTARAQGTLRRRRACESQSNTSCSRPLVR